MPEFEILEARTCEDVEAFAARMVVLSWTSNRIVLGEFNSFTLECRPGMTREDVMKPWAEAQRRSYFGD